MLQVLTEKELIENSMSPLVPMCKFNQHRRAKEIALGRSLRPLLHGFGSSGVLKGHV